MTDGGLGLILVVEDEPVLRMVMSDQLQDLGYSVIEASSADEALPVIRGDLPLLLMITDVELPGLDGRALAEEVRATRPGIGIVFSTGDVGGIRQWPGFDLGVMRAVGKPFQVEDLVTAIGELIDRPIAVQ